MRGAPSIAARVERVRDPGDLLAIAAATAQRPLFYWENPASGSSFLALGAVAEIRESGPGRFARASRAALDFLAAMPGSAGLRWVGGFGFSDGDPAVEAWRDFPALRLVLPEVLWTREGGECHRVRATPEGAGLLAPDAVMVAAEPGPWAPPLLDPAGERERRRFAARVDAVRAAIARGALSKVVLARRHDLVAASAIDPAAMLAAARARRPSCTSFWFGAGETSLVGSTPELLVRVRGRRVESEALAGSAPRGGSREEDRRLGEGLLACPKNRREHAMVADSVREALAPVTRALVSPSAPVLMRLPEAQHLHTPVRGERATPDSVLELAARLHPTPAVCGTPRAAARAWIEREENDRGWYSGAVGWMDASGGGEFVVALRTALADGERLSLWAGAGIVEGSDAAAELEETEAKLGALLGPGGARP